MRSFKLFWNVHKWTGVTLALVLATTATTGFLLLLKKRVDWIQPPTRQGAAGTIDDLISMKELFTVVLAQDHPDFRNAQDIERIDLRPGDRTFKVRSHRHYTEIQVCAITGEVLSVAWRPSDLFEAIHDGSYIAGWWHDWIMPVAPVALLVMIGSGLWLWMEPMFRRQRRRRVTAREAAAS